MKTPSNKIQKYELQRIKINLLYKLEDKKTILEPYFINLKK